MIMLDCGVLPRRLIPIANVLDGDHFLRLDR